MTMLKRPTAKMGGQQGAHRYLPLLTERRPWVSLNCPPPTSQHTHRGVAPRVQRTHQFHRIPSDKTLPRPTASKHGNYSKVLKHWLFFVWVVVCIFLRISKLEIRPVEMLITFVIKACQLTFEINNTYVAPGELGGYLIPPLAKLAIKFVKTNIALSNSGIKRLGNISRGFLQYGLHQIAYKNISSESIMQAVPLNITCVATTSRGHQPL